MGYLYSDIGLIGLEHNRGNEAKISALIEVIETIKNNIMQAKNINKERANKILFKADIAKQHLINQYSMVEHNNLNAAMVINSVLHVLDEIAISTGNTSEDERKIMHDIQFNFVNSHKAFSCSTKILTYVILGQQDYVWYCTNVIYNIHNMIYNDFPEIRTKNYYKNRYKALRVTPLDATNLRAYFIENVEKHICKILDNTLDKEYEIALEKKKTFDKSKELQYLSKVESIIKEFINREDKKQNLQNFLDYKGISISKFKTDREKMSKYDIFKDTLKLLDAELNGIRASNYVKLVGVMKQLAADIDSGIDYTQYCFKYKKNIKDMEEIFRATKQALSESEIKSIRTWLSKNKSKDKPYNKQEIMNTMYKDAQGNILYTDEMKTEVFTFMYKNNLPKTGALFNRLMKIYRETGKLEIII